MGGFDGEAHARNTKEAEASVAQMNDAVDQMKDLDTQLREKKMSNDQAQQKVEKLVKSIMTRMTSMMDLSQDNPQMIPALAKGASVISIYGIQKPLCL